MLFLKKKKVIAIALLSTNLENNQCARNLAALLANPILWLQWILSY